MAIVYIFAESHVEEADAPRSVLVVWNDAAISPYIQRSICGAQVEYTVEIDPLDKTEAFLEAPVKSQLYHDIPDFTFVPSSDTKSLIVNLGKTSRASSMSDEDFGLNTSSLYKYSSRFDGLDDKTDYVVSISTELNGKTVAQVTMTVSKIAQKKLSKSNNEASGTTRKDPE